MKIAIIVDGIVENVVLANKKTDVKPGKGKSVVKAPEWVAPGDSFDGEFRKKPAPAITAEQLGAMIKDECRGRIYAVIDETAQMNLAAEQSRLSETDIATYFDGLDWIKATRLFCGELIAAGDTGFATNPDWPEPGAAIIALAKAY